MRDLLQYYLSSALLLTTLIEIEWVGWRWLHIVVVKKNQEWDTTNKLTGPTLARKIKIGVLWCAQNINLSTNQLREGLPVLYYGHVWIAADKNEKNSHLYHFHTMRGEFLTHALQHWTLFFLPSCNFITKTSWKTMSILVNSLREEETYDIAINLLFLGHNRVIHLGGSQLYKPYLLLLLLCHHRSAWWHLLRAHYLLVQGIRRN